MGQNPHFIIDMSRVYREDESLVGKRAHELGILHKLGIPLPRGFVITTDFFKEFLLLTGIDKEIEKIKSLNHPAISDSIEGLFLPVRKQIMRSHIPPTLTMQLHKSYRDLSGTLREKPLSVFSSAFNHKSVVFPNVSGDANFVLIIKKIWSLSPAEPVAIVVQENIDPEIKGKIFTPHPMPRSSERGSTPIKSGSTPCSQNPAPSGAGQSENLQCPDPLRQSSNEASRKIVGAGFTDSPVADKKLTDEQMGKLINYCRIIQKHFYFPKEIEYAVRKNNIFITKINPFTGTVDEAPLPVIRDKQVKKVFTKGIPVNPGIVTGPVKVLHSKYDKGEIKRGEVVVLQNLDSFLFKKIKNAKAVIVDSSLSCSLDKALFRKKFQIPAIEGAKNATKLFRNGNVITVNGVSGEIYSGGIVY